MEYYLEASRFFHLKRCALFWLCRNFFSFLLFVCMNVCEICQNAMEYATIPVQLQPIKKSRICGARSLIRTVFEKSEENRTKSAFSHLHECRTKWARCVRQWCEWFIAPVVIDLDQKQFTSTIWTQFWWKRSTEMDAVDTEMPKSKLRSFTDSSLWV